MEKWTNNRRRGHCTRHTSSSAAMQKLFIPLPCFFLRSRTFARHHMTTNVCLRFSGVIFQARPTTRTCPTVCSWQSVGVSLFPVRCFSLCYTLSACTGAELVPAARASQGCRAHHRPNPRFLVLLQIRVTFFLLELVSLRMFVYLTSLPSLSSDVDALPSHCRRHTRTFRRRSSLISVVAYLISGSQRALRMALEAK